MRIGKRHHRRAMPVLPDNSRRTDRPLELVDQPQRGMQRWIEGAAIWQLCQVEHSITTQQQRSTLLTLLPCPAAGESYWPLVVVLTSPLAIMPIGSMPLNRAWPS